MNINQQRGFVLFEAIVCLSITVVILMLVSISFNQITNREEEKLARLNTFSQALAEVKRVEKWQSLPPISIEEKENSSEPPTLSEEYADYQIVELEEELTVTAPAVPSVVIPTIELESEFLKEDFNYEVTNKQTIRLYPD